MPLDVPVLDPSSTGRLRYYDAGELAQIDLCRRSFSIPIAQLNDAQSPNLLLATINPAGSARSGSGCEDFSFGGGTLYVQVSGFAEDASAYELILSAGGCP